ncbi:MAG: type II toxin-antitoxin system prevent-host-death family antitoxin [Planctomycetes bacterium]|nr:type II toxin-antitoxin system prevent-host-death family antitoxin [Planctomycetota bacterium]
MTTVTLTEAKAHLSRLLRRLASGEAILITHRGRPVGRLEPVLPEDDPGGERFRRLEEAGLLRRGKGGLGALDLPLPRPGKGGALLGALLEERAEGR